MTATAAAADLGGAVLPLTGELEAIAAERRPAAAQCGVTASQTWDLHLTAAGQTLDIPLYVVAATAAEAARRATRRSSSSACRRRTCPPAPRAARTFGAKLLSASFDVSAITQPVATGDYRWTSLFTPYNPGKGTPNRRGHGRDAVDPPHPDAGQAERHEEEADDVHDDQASRARRSASR